MQHALDLARRGLGKTYPNPAVGCVLVKNGQVLTLCNQEHWATFIDDLAELS